MIVASDHGQGMGEHGNMGHGPILWESVLHIPLIMRDFRKRRDGRRVEDTVSAIDLAPTIADAAIGIPLPGIQGRSLLPYLSRRTPEDTHDAVFGEVRLDPDLEKAPEWYDPEQTALYADDLKFETYHGEVIVWDPGGSASSETRLEDPPLADSFVEYVQSLRAEFLDRERQPTVVELTNPEIEALRSLGYIQ